MGLFDFAGKTFLVMGVANKKSIAWGIAQSLEKSGAHVIYSVRSEKRFESLKELLKDREIYVCDVENSEEIQQLAASISEKHSQINGFVHSIAFGNYSEGFRPFHETKRTDFLQATTISCFSLIEIANALKHLLARDASVVTIGISSQVAAPAYGYMSPIKAALESAVRFLAKSFSKGREVRFNCVKAGPLKTSASAGIPGYIANYLYAEKMTLRKRAITTQEVANAALFLLSDLSSGINGQGIVVNAGMDFNYFDEELVNLN
ncbi:MAG: SDR family oxidoreductase [Puniceicoccales bacterium]|jgi:enoyl-[acyl-carrier protein] reductase I|nr:SDR family oxidoreductase [Puniceicoccales bacterium]